MLFYTIIHGDMGAGKTMVAGAMAARYANMKVHEVNSMAEVRGVLTVDRSDDYHHVFVCGHNFFFGAHDLADALGVAYNLVNVYKIYMTKHA